MGAKWNNAKVDRTDIDRKLEEYWRWCENWSELRDWEKAYLKALAYRLALGEKLNE